MKRYKRQTEKKIEEKFQPQSEEERAEKVNNIIERLVGETFGNKEQRSAMASMIGSLARESNRGNKEARQFLKELGKMCDNWGNGNFDPKDMPKEELSDDEDKKEDPVQEEIQDALSVNMDDIKESLKQELKKEVLDEIKKEINIESVVSEEKVSLDESVIPNHTVSPTKPKKLEEGITEYKIKW